MKKIIKLTFIGIAMTVALTGCLKDKGFDNGEYGVQVNEVKGVSLPQSVAGALNVGILSQTEPQILAAPVIALEAINRQSSDVHVQFALKPSLVEADPSLTLLPADQYTVDLNATIAAGQMNDTLEINVTNSSNLDPNLTYGLGLELISADNGFQVASNMKEILIKIVVKNIYDGDYIANGYFYHPSVPRSMNNIPKTMYTYDPTSVAVGLGDLEASGYYSVFTVDPATNQVTVSDYPGSVPGVVMYTSSLPATHPNGSATGYTPQWSRSAECNNTYDPVTKSFKMRYGYVGATGYRVSEEIITRVQ